MKSFVVAALAAVALANPMPQAVTSAISPTGAAPASCTASLPGNYEITVVKPGAAAKRDLEEVSNRIASSQRRPSINATSQRDACGGTGTLVVTLDGGVLKDALGRTAYIASNNQFQFDGPPQAGAIFTSGFSVCQNESIALGDTTVFYQCLSGSFYNLYNTNWAPQCSPVALNVIPCQEGGATTSAATSATTDAPSTPVATQSTDGQPEGTSVLTQLSDAQPNGPSATTAAVLTQLSDAQPNGPSATAIPLSQFSDGQPQLPTPLLSQLSDAQPVATAPASGAPNATIATSSPTITPFTGAANLPVIGEMAAIAGGLAVVALL